MNDQPVLRTPGERLASLRTAAGLSLAEVAESTKIPLPMLQAIELDEYHKISGELYVKSFLRSYAAEVGLEIEEVLSLYANFSGGGTDAAGGSGSAIWQEEEVQIKRLGVPWTAVGLVSVAVILVGIVGYVLLRGGGAESEPKPAQTPAESGAPETGGEGTESLPDSVSTQTPALTSPVTSPETVKVEPKTTDPAVARPEVKAIPVKAPSDDSLSPSEAGLGGTLQIDGRTWPVVLRLVCPVSQGVSLKKDGDRRYSKVDWPSDARPLDASAIKAGKAYQVNEGLAVYWGAEDHFSLKVDNPAGLRVTINGVYRDISGLGPGEEIILNDPAVINSNLPSARSADRP